MPDETVYCICRTTDIKRFMIACDKCEEWFHGDCIHITLKASKAIEKYFCRKCIEVDPTLQITYKPGKKAPTEGAVRKKPAKKKRDTSLTPSLSSRGSSDGRTAKGSREDARRSTTDTDSSGEDEWNGQVDPRRSLPIDPDSSRRGTSKSKKTTNKPKDDTQQRRPSESCSKAPKEAAIKSATPATSRPVGGEHAAGSVPVDGKKVLKSPKAGRKHSSSHYLRRNSPRRSPSQDNDDDWPGFDWANLRQCYGPKCKFAAAPGSKYCSDDCGRALARKRLLEIMPIRLEQMDSQTYAATQSNQNETEAVRQKLVECKTMVEKLFQQKASLEQTILKGKREQPCSQDEEEHHGEDSTSDNCDVHCITCGLPTPLRTAVKHFEKCFNRYENQTSYGSLVPTPNSIFCDIQNPKTKTWCKRLKVLCPEHFRESVEDTAGVCGMPLTNEDFVKTGKFCRIPKKNCSKHPSWERVKRAELDLEVLRAYMRMEELVEQETILMRTIQSRGGIVQSLLNYSLAHRPEDGKSAASSTSSTSLSADASF
ncbi:CXXC-type zinc finger protein 1 [Hypsibius exemplaris]|uniref:CXXC-type zinc finger protein 1 n=1 Tax=Hypsibius exemplaris TaxID=2072580 RepID=A0A1W0X7R6_HYPEX|nr:CXXC-type zinc finger protein 1 [Hypsibius exemplaris]